MGSRLPDGRRQVPGADQFLGAGGRIQVERPVRHRPSPEPPNPAHACKALQPWACAPALIRQASREPDHHPGAVMVVPVMVPVVVGRIGQQERATDGCGKQNRDCSFHVGTSPNEKGRWRRNHRLQPGPWPGRRGRRPRREASRVRGAGWKIAGPGRSSRGLPDHLGLRECTCNAKW